MSTWKTLMKMTKTADNNGRKNFRTLLLAAIVGGIFFIPMVAFAGGPATDNPTPSQQKPMRYVALGDSVASGAGLGVNYSRDDDSAGVCYRSGKAYPYEVAKSLSTEVEHYACMGAKVDEGIYDSQTRDETQLFPQLDKAFLSGTPDLITMTIGANDARWVEFIQGCYATECGSTAEDYATKVLRADLRLELARTLSEIKSRSEGEAPRVMISGYYNPFSTDVSCLSKDRITPNEVTWLQQQHNELNKSIRETVELYDFAEYVPVDFTGHDVCSDDSWLLSMMSSAPLHPDKDGQQAIARAFIAQL